MGPYQNERCLAYKSIIGPHICFWPLILDVGPYVKNHCFFISFNENILDFLKSFFDNILFFANIIKESER